MSHRPSMDPDSPDYSNDDPTWSEPMPKREQPEIVKAAYVSLRLIEKRRRAQAKVDEIDKEIAAAQARVRELAGESGA